MGLTMIWSYPVILVGRVMVGFCGGLFSSIVPRYIEETIPTNIQATVTVFFVFSQTFGSFVAMMWGDYLPKDTDHWALLHT